MKQLTTDKPEDNVMTALNRFYVKDGETWVRGGGEAPHYPDVTLFEYIRRIVGMHRVEDVFPGNDEDLNCLMAELVMDGPDDIEGLIATLYTTAWAFSELRERLKAYEDTGMEPEDIKELLTTHRTEICESSGYDCVELGRYRKAEQDGRLVVLDTAPEDSYGGLKRKYIVFKSDSGEPVENCFVLRPDKDPAAKIALEAYAKATDNQELADDIFRWVGDSGKVLVLPCKVGDTVYQPMTGNYIHEFAAPDIAWILDFRGSFGKTIYVTREAAEAALAERERGSDHA